MFIFSTSDIGRVALVWKMFDMSLGAGGFFESRVWAGSAASERHVVVFSY